MTITNIAKVVRWNGDKGFGFAEANGIRYFVHKTALGRTVRPPKVGDTIVVERFGNSEKGPRIEKGTLDGVALIQSVSGGSQRCFYNVPKRNKGVRKFMLALCIVVAMVSSVVSIVGKCEPSRTCANREKVINVNGQYTSKVDVAKFICDYGHLPNNYVNKSEGKRLFEQKTGRIFSKWNFNPWTTIGVMIGGDDFSNRDGYLPSGVWYEADVDYYANNRGTNRLVYGENCQIYYTGDHYKSFVKIEFQ